MASDSASTRTSSSGERTLHGALTLGYDERDPGGTIVPLGPLPPFPSSEVFATFSAAYIRQAPDIAVLQRAGFPCSMDRKAFVAKPRAFPLTLFKKATSRMTSRLRVQIPLYALEDSPLEEVADEQIRARWLAERVKVTTIFDFLRPELVGILSRPLLGRLLAMLARRDDVSHLTLSYTADSVLDAPLKYLLPNGDVKLPARYATLHLLSPAEEATATPINGSLHMSHSPASLFEPSRETRDLLQRILDHLERRGGIWTHAACATHPGFRNADPSSRPEFVVLGIFPKAFLQRCAGFMRNSTPMPSDCMPRSHSQAPLTVVTSSPTSVDTTRDLLEGWSVRVTFEPYRTLAQSKYAAPLGQGLTTGWVVGAGMSAY